MASIPTPSRFFHHTWQQWLLTTNYQTISIFRIHSTWETTCKDALFKSTKLCTTASSPTHWLPSCKTNKSSSSYVNHIMPHSYINSLSFSASCCLLLLPFWLSHAPFFFLLLNSLTTNYEEIRQSVIHHHHQFLVLATIYRHSISRRCSDQQREKLGDSLHAQEDLVHVWIPSCGCLFNTPQYHLCSY